MSNNQNISVHHSFDVQLAILLGSPELSILVHHFAYWVRFNERLGKNFRDGCYWTYQTHHELHAHFPYWTPRHLRTLIDKLVKIGILIKGNYNKSVIDHTTWFTLDFKNFDIAVKNDKSPRNDVNEEKYDLSGICQNRQTCDEIDKCIPDTIPTDTEQPVCVVPAKAAIRFCEIITSSKGKVKFSFEDLMSKVILGKKSWTNDEIEEAWSILCRYGQPVNDWFNFIEGTIKKIRIKKHNTNKKDMSCQMQKNTQEVLKKPRESYSGKDTWGHPLANFARQNGLGLCS